MNLRSFLVFVAAGALCVAMVAAQGQGMNDFDVKFDIKNPATVFPQSPSMQRLAQAVLKDDVNTLVAGLKAQPSAANESGVHGVGLLMIAVANSRRDPARLLVRAGADPHRSTSEIANLGRPASLALRMRGQPDMFTTLMEEGIDLNGGKEGEGETLLALAILERDDYRLRQLLASGKVNVNLANDAQMTPLMVAIRSRQYGKAMLLLDAGADPALGRINPLQVLARHKWEPGSQNDLEVKQLTQRLRAMRLAETTQMHEAPVRPAGAPR